MVINRCVWLTLTFLLFSAFWLQAQAAPEQVEQPGNVTLLYFIGWTTENQDEVILEWETATELGTAGFFIVRRTGADGPFVYLDNIGFIHAEGGPAIGAWYQAADDSVVLDQTYTYRLIEVEASGHEIVLEDITITVGVPSPNDAARLYLPLITRN